MATSWVEEGSPLDDYLNGELAMALAALIQDMTENDVRDTTTDTDEPNGERASRYESRTSQTSVADLSASEP